MQWLSCFQNQSFHYEFNQSLEHFNSQKWKCLILQRYFLALKYALLVLSIIIGCWNLSAKVLKIPLHNLRLIKTGPVQGMIDLKFKYFPFCLIYLKHAPLCSKRFLADGTGLGILSTPVSCVLRVPEIFEVQQLTVLFAEVVQSNRSVGNLQFKSVISGCWTA